MARFQQGISGPFSGKIGTVIGSSWKGIPYAKSVYKKRSTRVGASEQANRNKFGLAQLWLRPLLDFVREGFRNYSPTVEGFIAAKSYLLKNAVEVTKTGTQINPALVKVSYGTLPLPANVKVKKAASGQLRFSWNTTIAEDSNTKDQAMLLAYDIDHAEAICSLTGQFRETGADTLPISTAKGKTYHIYMAFVAHDRSRQSDSIYLGTITT